MVKDYCILLGYKHSVMDKPCLKKVTVLGSGTSFGVPVIGCQCDVCQSDDPRDKRTRSSILLETSENKKIVVDTGPEFRIQLIRESVDNIDAVFYTHLHADHLHGFDDLRVFSYKNNKPLKVYLPTACIPDLKARFHYIFNPNSYQGTLPQIELIPFEEGDVQIAGLNFEVIFLPHGGVQSAAFKVDKFAYATDFTKFSEEQIASWTGKIQSMIASGIRFKNPHYSHSLIPETENLFKSLQIKNGFIHHLSHEVGHSFDRLIDQSCARLHGTNDE